MNVTYEDCDDQLGKFAFHNEDEDGESQDGDVEEHLHDADCNESWWQSRQMGS